MAKLYIKVSETESIEFPIEKKSTIIGRSAECDLVIDNSYISSQHAVVHRSDDNAFIIEDKESTHGVKVNDVKIIAEKLKHGDAIRLGQLDIIFSSIAEVSSLSPPNSAPQQPSPPALDAPILRRNRPVAPNPQTSGSSGSETSKLRTALANATPTPLVRPNSAAAPSNTAPETKSSTAVASGPLTKPLSRARKTAIIRSGLPVPKPEQGPRTSQISSVPETIGTSSHTESEIAEMEQKLAELQEKETNSRRKYDDAMEEMRTNVAELTKQRRKLREEIDDLSDRHRTINARVDDEDDAFLPVVYEMVKRVDLLENLITTAKNDKKVNDDFVKQLETLSKSFSDLYDRHNIKQENIEPGTALNMMLRRRIKIVDESGHEDLEAHKTDQPKMPSQPKVLKTVRPGIIYSPVGGAEAILRKVEVVVEHS